MVVNSKYRYILPDGRSQLAQAREENGEAGLNMVADKLLHAISDIEMNAMLHSRRGMQPSLTHVRQLVNTTGTLQAQREFEAIMLEVNTLHNDNTWQTDFNSLFAFIRQMILELHFLILQNKSK